MRRFSRQERGPADLVASAVTTNSPHVVVVVLRLQSVSPFATRRFWCVTTTVLLLPLKRRPLRRRSPHPNRFVKTISPVAYTFDLPTVGRGRASPVMTQDHFLQAATCSTLNGSPAITAVPPKRRSSELTPSASSKGGDWRPMKAENAVSQSLPAWLLQHRPFSGPPGGTTLAAYLR